MAAYRFYTLHDPLDWVPVYVGVTTQKVEARLLRHIGQALSEYRTEHGLRLLDSRERMLALFESPEAFRQMGVVVVPASGLCVPDGRIKRRKMSRKSEWVMDLLRNDRRPAISLVVELETDGRHALLREQQLIEEMRERNPDLLNARGGPPASRVA